MVNKVYGARGDATGQGLMPMEYLAAHTPLPVYDESMFTFTIQSKAQLYSHFQEAHYKDPSDDFAFSYPLNHPLTAEFEDQTTRLIRSYKGDGEYLSVSHPDEPDARDDAPDSTALSLLAGAGGSLGEILVA